MKKKKINIILILLLCFIWGSVFYKFFIKTNNSYNQAIQITNSSFQEFNYDIIKDTFNLVFINENPFKVSKKNKPIINKIVTKKPLKKGNDKKTIWPNVSYFGFVKSKSNTTKLTLIKVDNKLYRKRENETIDDIRIVKAYSDSIIISLNDVNKTIKTK